MGGDHGESTGQIAAGGDGCKAESSSGRMPGESDEWLRPGGNQLDDWLEIPLAQGRIRTPTSVQNSDTRHLFPGVGQLCRSKDKKGYGSSVSDNTPREVGGVETSNYHPASALCRTLLILNSMIHVKCLNHPETIPHPPPVRGRVVIHETGPCCQRGWGPLSYRELGKFMRRATTLQAPPMGLLSLYRTCLFSATLRSLRLEVLSL